MFYVATTLKFIKRSSDIWIRIGKPLNKTLLCKRDYAKWKETIVK